jgi:hypothetical protein
VLANESRTHRIDLWPAPKKNRAGTVTFSEGIFYPYILRGTYRPIDIPIYTYMNTNIYRITNDNPDSFLQPLLVLSRHVVFCSYVITFFYVTIMYHRIKTLSRQKKDIVFQGGSRSVASRSHFLNLEMDCLLP